MNTEEPQVEAPEPPKEIQNPKLSLIARHAAADLVQLLAEREEELLQAWTQASEEAQLQEKSAIFKVGYAISLDLDGDKMTTVLTFAVRRKLEIVRSMPDPTQPELDLADGDNAPRCE